VLTVGPKTVARPLCHANEGEARSVESEVRRILFATDFTPESLAAAPFAFSFAQEHQAKLFLLHVVERPELDYARDPQRNLQYLASELKALIPEDADLWCEPEVLVEFGPAADRILDLSQELAADLIVMGVRRAKDQLFASSHLPVTTAHKVVCDAPCPVLTVLG
jgi:nucleotide-binding universal stress UspA family protein